MMPGHFTSDIERDELVGRIGNLYVRQGLSPPSQLRDSAIKHRLGLSHDEILAAIEQHFAEHRRLYTRGSGDGLFYMFEAAIRAAWRRHPLLDRADDAPERPRRRAGRVRKMHNATGIPDAFVEGRTARLLRDSDQARELRSDVGGCERVGVTLGEDDEADA